MPEPSRHGPQRTGPDPMDFGVSPPHGGADATFTITNAHSDALLTARIADDTSQGRFRIASLTSYTVVRAETGGELPGGRPGGPPPGPGIGGTKLEESDTTDGSRPL